MKPGFGRLALLPLGCALMVACSDATPTRLSDDPSPPSLSFVPGGTPILITDPTDPDQLGERFVICKYGPDSQFQVRQDATLLGTVTVADDPWEEITRIAERSGCDKVVLGVGTLGRSMMAGPLERLIGRVDADVVVIRAPDDWDPDMAESILVPARGGRAHSPIRARVVGSLCHEAPRNVTYLGVLPKRTSEDALRRAEGDLERLARDEARRAGYAVVARNDDFVEEIVWRAAQCDLMILGLSHSDRRGRVFGERALEIAEATDCPLLMISQRV